MTITTCQPIQAGRFRACLLGLMFLTLGLTLGLPLSAQPIHELNDEGEFIQLPEPEPGTPEGDLQLIRRMIVEGEFDDAEDAADDWIEAHPGHPNVVEAHMLRGDAIASQGDYYRSLHDYEQIITVYPGTEYYRRAIEREYDIAILYTRGLNRRGNWLGFRWFPADDIGIELLIRVQERLPGSALGERASIDIGDYYFDRGEMDMASEAYDLFIENYPRSQQREWAMLRQIQASLARYKGPQFDPSGLTDAAQRLREYAREYPAAAERIGAEALMVRINESLAEKRLATAQWYEQRGLERGAITTYRNLIQNYPRSVAARAALEALEERGVPLIDPRGPLAQRNANPTANPDTDDSSIDPNGGGQ